MDHMDSAAPARLHADARRQLSQEFLHSRSDCNYLEYIKDHWGLQMRIPGTGELISTLASFEYTVVDEQKYLMYLLKFG